MNNEMIIACAVISLVSLLISSYLFAKDRARTVAEEERNDSKGGTTK